jgi:type II secretory pathway pseudopilin PulG
MPTSRAGTRSSQQGFTYAAVLAAVVIVGIAAEVGYLSTSRIVQAEREAELLFRGAAYARAIGRYHRAHGVYPRALDDLVVDPRSPSQHHIRALYGDPMAPEGQGWALIPATDGGIAGVASRSKKRPLKRANFPLPFEHFAGAESYSEWLFESAPAGAGLRAGQAKRKLAAAP